VAVLVDESRAAERSKRLVDMAGSKGILQHLLRLLDHFLHREFFVAVVQVSDHAKQFSLSIGCARPAPSKKSVSNFRVMSAMDTTSGFPSL